MTGGVLDGNPPRLTDTLWHWTGTAWRALSGEGPAGRTMAAAAFDTRRGVFVLYGGIGIGSGTRLGDTWEWDGRAWAQHNVRTPGPRDHHAMAYDEARRQTVMFGGRAAEGDTRFPAGTWLWDGAAWTAAGTDGGPPGFGHHAMAYDSRRQRVVMYGGVRDDRRDLADTWEWDGATWHRIVTLAGPGPRSRHRMAYDAARGVIVLFGGNDGRLLDTWTWDGTAWRQAATAGPPPRWVHAMAYDRQRQAVVLFGGGSSVRPYAPMQDLWEWNGEGWTRRH